MVVFLFDHFLGLLSEEKQETARICRILHKIPLILVVATIPPFWSSIFNISISSSDLPGLVFLDFLIQHLYKKYRTSSCENQDPSFPPVIPRRWKKNNMLKLSFPISSGFLDFTGSVTLYPISHHPKFKFCENSSRFMTFIQIFFSIYKFSFTSVFLTIQNWS